MAPGVNGFVARRPSSRALALTSGFACSPAYTRSTGMPSPVPPTLVRPPIALASGSGILTGFPSPTPLGLGLGTDLPCADRLDAGNLRFSARGVLTRVVATYADRVNSIRSTRPSGAASLLDGTLSYHRMDPKVQGSEASVRGLAPLYCRCRAA